MHDGMEKKEAKKKSKEKKNNQNPLKLHDASLLSFRLNAFGLLKRYIGCSHVQI